MTVMDRVTAHYKEALEYFPSDKIVGIYLQGSQNYGLEIPGSDVDTKLITLPSFEDIVFNRKPVSTTHIRENEEHIDFKDIRLMFGTFRKQNLNFLEILFTDYFILNEKYAEEWLTLVEHREEIAHYNQFAAIKSMKGIALEKYHAMKHLYPSKIAIIEKFGYDPKQLHHLLRVKDYLTRYMAGESYESCLKPTDPDFLKEVKMGYFSLEQAEVKAMQAVMYINSLTKDVTKDSKWNVTNSKVDELLDTVQAAIIRKSLTDELLKAEGVVK